MKASEVIEQLNRLKLVHGDLEVFIDADGLLPIDEIDFPVDEEGIIIWPVYEADKD